jgi:hypothetical protein
MKYIMPDEVRRATLTIQKSVYSTKDQIDFTINLGVVDPTTRDRLHEASEVERRLGNNVVLRQHGGSWGWRLYQLMPMGTPPWWSVTAASDIAELTATVVGAIRDYALPAMRIQLDEPLPTPLFTIETIGDPFYVLPGPDGRDVWVNVGGRQVWP